MAILRAEGCRTRGHRDILPRSMLTISRQFRSLIALLLAVVVPFCCCNFYSWLKVCAPCEPATLVAGVGQLPSRAHDHRSCHHSDEPASAVGSAAQQDPDLPADDSDPQDCTCGKHQAKMLSGVKPTLELPASVLVAILHWATVEWPDAEQPGQFMNGAVSACARPPTSLLRMHCALIV